MEGRIMYMECKGTESEGKARIGRVTETKFSRHINYQGKSYQPHFDRGNKANYYEVGSGQWYWITGANKNGLDSLDAKLVEIDDDVQQEYWESIRNNKESIGTKSFQSPGKHYKA
jgi:hypothetical protein